MRCIWWSATGAKTTVSKICARRIGNGMQDAPTKKKEDQQWTLNKKKKKNAIATPICRNSKLAASMSGWRGE